jgi:hypothetical protein
VDRFTFCAFLVAVAGGCTNDTPNRDTGYRSEPCVDVATEYEGLTIGTGAPFVPLAGQVLDFWNDDEEDYLHLSVRVELDTTFESNCMKSLVFYVFEGEEEIGSMVHTAHRLDTGDQWISKTLTIPLDRHPRWRAPGKLIALHEDTEFAFEFEFGVLEDTYILAEAEWTDGGAVPEDTDGDGVPDTGCDDAVQLHLYHRDAPSDSPWFFGIAETGAALGVGRSDEDCLWPNDCHPFTAGPPFVLHQVANCAPDSVIPGSNTRFDASDQAGLTYYLEDVGGDCFTWGHDPSYYDGWNCEELVLPGG